FFFFFTFCVLYPTINNYIISLSRPWACPGSCVGSPGGWPRPPPIARNDWRVLSDLGYGGAFPGKRFSQFFMMIVGIFVSLGAALVPKYLIEREVEEGALTELGETPLTTENSYYFVRPAGVKNPDIDDFLKWLKRSIPKQ
ncbi:MAG: hypothetical protein AAGC95_18765, partial [Pseudomonadota bacterium]